MAPVLNYVFAGLLVVFAGYCVRETWTYYTQYRTISGIDLSGPLRLEPGTTATVFGSARVIEPVAPTDQPDEVREVEHHTGLIAWRVRRRKRRRGRIGSDSGVGHRYRWETEGAGLEVGRLAIETPDGTVDVDADAARNLLPQGWGTVDPWESTALHLGDPDEDVSITDPRDVGPRIPFDIELGTLDLGEKSRFQANYVSEGDTVLVHGELVETGDGLVLTEGSDTSLVIATGTIGETIGQLRENMAKNALLAVTFVVIAVAVAAGYTGGVEFTFQ